MLLQEVSYNFAMMVYLQKYSRLTVETLSKASMANDKFRRNLNVSLKHYHSRPDWHYEAPLAELPTIIVVLTGIMRLQDTVPNPLSELPTIIVVLTGIMRLQDTVPNPLAELLTIIVVLTGIMRLQDTVPNPLAELPSTNHKGLI